MKKSPPSERRDRYAELPAGRDLCEFKWLRTEPETGRTVAGYDRESTPLSAAVPAIVAECAGVAPLSLPPMYDCIDVDALEGLAGESRRTDCDVTVRFRYAGYIVGVDGGRLSVQPAE